MCVCVCVWNRREQQPEPDWVSEAFWLNVCVVGQSYCMPTVLCVFGILHVWGKEDKYSAPVCVCVLTFDCACASSQSAWLSECNGSALMDAHLSWSVQSVAEVQPSLASSPAWKPYNLLSTIQTLFPPSPFSSPPSSVLSLPLYQFNIFIPTSLTEPADRVSPLSPY